MTHVFISYARKDWAVANALVQELEARGFATWWDREIVGGDRFHERIAEHLDTASAVIVIWSENSARSDWVVGEAGRATRTGNLIGTSFPDFPFSQIPKAFQEQHVESVADIDRIVHALTSKGIQPRRAATSIAQPAPGDRIAQSIRAIQEERTQQITYFLPIMVLVLTMFLGIGVVVAANTIGIAWVRWIADGGASGRLIKEVGYVPALNWSFAGIILFPLAWSLVILAVETLFDIRRRMVQSQMIVTTQFEPITSEDSRFVRFFGDVRRMTILLIGVLTTLIILFALHEFYSEIFAIYQDPAATRDLNRIGFSYLGG